MQEELKLLEVKIAEEAAKDRETERQYYVVVAMSLKGG